MKRLQFPGKKASNLHQKPRNLWIFFYSLFLIAGISCGVPIRHLITEPADTATPSPSLTFSPEPSSTPVPRTSTPSPSPEPTDTIKYGFKLMNPEIGTGSDVLNNIWSSPTEYLWLGSKTGVFIFRQGEWSFLPEGKDSLVLGQDTDGRTWVLMEEGEKIGSYYKGVWIFYGKNENWTKPADPEYLGRGFGDTIIVDPENMVWLATGGNEIRRLNQETGFWMSFTAEDLGFDEPQHDNYQGHFLTDVVLSERNNVWASNCIGIGEDLTGQGVRTFDGSKWHEISQTSAECVYDMEADPTGKLWISAFDRVLHYNQTTNQWQSYPLPLSESRQVVTQIDISPSGMIWIKVARSGGASLFGDTLYYRLQGETWQTAYSPGIWENTDLTFDGNGTPWICTDGPEAEVFRERDGRFVKVEGSFNAYGCQIEADQSGNLWLYFKNGPDAGLWMMQ